MPVGGAPPWLTHTSTIRQSHGKCSRDFRVQGLLEVRLVSTRRPAKQGFPCFHSQGRGVAASYCAFAGCELRSVIHHHKATPRNHRPRKSLCRPKASSYGRPWAPASPKSPRGREALFLPLGSDAAPALDGNLSIHTVAAHKGGVCVYVCCCK